jgi:hypothetical protein
MSCNYTTEGIKLSGKGVLIRTDVRNWKRQPDKNALSPDNTPFSEGSDIKRGRPVTIDLPLY